MAKYSPITAKINLEINSVKEGLTSPLIMQSGLS